MIVNFLVVLAVLCLVIWKTVQKKSLPPLAAGALPILGHTVLVLKSIDRLYEIVLEYMLGTPLRQGKDISTIRCGAWNIYVIMNAEDGLILANSCLEKDVLYDFFTPLFGQGLVNCKVPIWKKHRKLLNPTFNQSVLDLYQIEFNRAARELVKTIAQEEGKGLFDPLPYLKYTTLDLIMSTALGTNGIKQETADYIAALTGFYNSFTEGMVERSRKFWYHNDFLYGLSSLKKKQYQIGKDFHDITVKFIQKKKEDSKTRPQFDFEDQTKSRYRGFIDLLLDLHDDGELTDEEVQDEVKTFILTGSDTTAHAVSLTLLLVGSYPDVQKKVYEELLAVFEGTDRDVEKQDLPKLKYLDAVLKETMRLYPTVVGFGRRIQKDVKLKDYILPVGSRCYVSVYSICRHPVWGEDATVFRPERWLNPDSLPRNHNAFAVFGLGRRNCIGLQYAMTSMKTILVHLLRQYHMTGDVTNLVRRLDIVVRMVSGHHIGMEPRITLKS